MFIGKYGLKTFVILGIVSAATALAQDSPVRLVADLEDQPMAVDLLPSELIPVADQVFFTARGSKVGEELWRSDGTSLGTDWVADLCPGRCDGSPRILATDGARMLLAVGSRVWISDGTDAGTLPLIVPCSECRRRVILRDGKWTGTHFLFLVIEDGPIRLWSSDGTAAGTGPIDLQGRRVTSLFLPGETTTYFSAAEDDQRTFLYATDGSQTGTREVAELCDDCGLSFYDAKNVGDKTVLLGFSSSYEPQPPWVTDGTAAGTMMLPDLSDGSSPFEFPFLMRVGDHVITQLWRQCEVNCLYRTDGTVAGTQLAPELYPPGPDRRQVERLAAVGDTLYMDLRNRDSGDRELWAAQGSGPALLQTGDTMVLGAAWMECFTTASPRGPWSGAWPPKAP